MDYLAGNVQLVIAIFANKKHLVPTIIGYKVHFVYVLLFTLDGSSRLVRR